MTARTLVDKEVEFLSRLSSLVERIPDDEFERLRLAIAEVAYHKSEQRGFAPGHELEDWAMAEIEVTQRWRGRRNSADDIDSSS